MWPFYRPLTFHLGLRIGCFKDPLKGRAQYSREISSSSVDDMEELFLSPSEERADGAIETAPRAGRNLARVTWSGWPQGVLVSGDNRWYRLGFSSFASINSLDVKDTGRSAALVGPVPVSAQHHGLGGVSCTSRIGHCTGNQNQGNVSPSICRLVSDDQQHVSHGLCQRDGTGC